MNKKMALLVLPAIWLTVKKTRNNVLMCSPLIADITSDERYSKLANSEKKNYKQAFEKLQKL